MSKNKLNVLVTGVGGGGHGAQIMKALKLAETQYTIVGTDMSPYSLGLAEVDYPYILPAANDEKYISSLLHLCKKHDIKAIFHGSEPELKVLSQQRHQFIERDIFLPINDNETIELCMDKVKCSDRLTELGFNVPRFKKIKTTDDLKDFSYFPAVLKPSIGGGGSANIFLAQNQAEALSYTQHLLTLYQEFIIQEYVGTADEEYTVGVLMDMDGNFINSIAVKRFILSSLSNRVKIPNKSSNTQLGKTLAISSGISQGIIGKFPQVTQVCEKLTAMLHCKGAVNIQCRLANGKVQIFEINPRFSGTTSLRAMVGYNEPDLLIRKHIFHESIKPNFTYKEGAIMRGLREVYLESTNFPICRE